MIHATITITAADERALKDALMEARHALVVERKTFWLDSGKRLVGDHHAPQHARAFK
jgi:hypothetical protein